MLSDPISPIPPNPDASLIVRTREGDNLAFGELWSRHATSGYAYARQYTSATEPDDLVAEAFLQILQALRNGRGPTSEFRSYMFAVIRNLARKHGRAVHHEIASDDLDTVEAQGSDPDSITARAREARTVAQAFRSLPPRWQRVLWLIDVEGLKPAQVALILGISANSASSLAFRAREGLRDAWVQMQVASENDARDCAWVREHLGAYARHHLTPRHQLKVDRHLHTCTACSTVARETIELAGVLTAPVTISEWRVYPDASDTRDRATSRTAPAAGSS